MLRSVYRPELQVCTATRSPCGDQALPLSWAPPSSAEGGKSPQGQPCCRLQWLRLSTFNAAGRLTEFFREPRHHQMPGRSWRAGKAIAAMESPQALIAPLKRGSGGLERISDAEMHCATILFEPAVRPDPSPVLTPGRIVDYHTHIQTYKDEIQV